jgi:hypothetical protein
MSVCYMIFITLRISMKYLRLHPIELIIILLFTLGMLQGCAPNPGTWIDEQISSGNKDNFHQMNTLALQYLKDDNMDALSSMLSKELIDDRYTNHTVDMASNALKASDYKLLDDYYIVRDSSKLDTVKIASSQHSKNIYNLEYTGAAGEKYIAFFVPKSGFNNTMLISIVYYKYDYGWKIFSLNTLPYTINGKTAPQLLAIGKQQMANDQLVPALNSLQLAADCVRPADMWVYPEEGEISRLNSKLLSAANSKFSFPVVLTQVSTQPKIISIANESNGDGTYPEIYYISSIKVADTDAIKQENAQIRKIIGNVIPGIDKNSEYLLYSASNKMPSASTSTSRFDMIDKLQ